MKPVSVKFIVMASSSVIPSRVPVESNMKVPLVSVTVAVIAPIPDSAARAFNCFISLS